MSEELTQVQAEACVVMVASKSLAEASRTLGCAPSTLYRMRAKPAVQRELQRLRRAALSAAAERLAQHVDDAVATLAEVMSDREAPAAARVSAAKTVIDRSRSTSNEADLLARLEAIEAKAEAARGVRLSGPRGVVRQ